MRRWFLMGGLLGGAVTLRRRLGRRDPLDLRDRVILITGAASGIGRATAHAFAAEGARLVLADRDEDGLNRVQEELAAYDTPTLVVPADVRDDDQLAALLEATLGTFGRLDVLVSNAGVALGGPFHEQDAARLRAMLETNLYGALRLLQLAVPVMLRQGSGHIVVVSSTTAPVPTPGLAGYGATKAALYYVARALRHELAGTGVRVSVVLPGWTATPMVAPVPEEPIQAAGIRADAPEVPARAIVDAVRYNLPQVILGGRATALFLWIERLAPRLMGRIWKGIVTPDYLDAVKHL